MILMALDLINLLIKWLYKISHIIKCHFIIMDTLFPLWENNYFEKKINI